LLLDVSLSLSPFPRACQNLTFTSCTSKKENLSARTAIALIR
jgi:hypothetical protein